MIDIDKAFNNRWRIKGFDEHEVRQLSGKDVARLCRDFFEAGLALGDPGVQSTVIVDKKKSTNLFERSIPFQQSVFTPENEQKYGQQMLRDFYDYWSEPNPSHTKMRFELQKTWDLDRRLARWARNNFNRYDRQQSTDNKLDKLTDILVG